MDKTRPAPVASASPPDGAPESDFLRSLWALGLNIKNIHLTAIPFQSKDGNAGGSTKRQRLFRHSCLLSLTVRKNYTRENDPDFLARHSRRATVEGYNEGHSFKAVVALNEPFAITSDELLQTKALRTDTGSPTWTKILDESYRVKVEIGFLELGGLKDLVELTFPSPEGRPRPEQHGVFYLCPMVYTGPKPFSRKYSERLMFCNSTDIYDPKCSAEIDLEWKKMQSGHRRVRTAGTESTAMNSQQSPLKRLKCIYCFIGDCSQSRITSIFCPLCAGHQYFSTVEIMQLHFQVQHPLVKVDLMETKHTDSGIEAYVRLGSFPQSPVKENGSMASKGLAMADETLEPVQIDNEQNTANHQIDAPEPTSSGAIARPMNDRFSAREDPSDGGSFSRGRDVSLVERHLPRINGETSSDVKGTDQRILDIGKTAPSTPENSQPQGHSASEDHTNSKGKPSLEDSSAQSSRSGLPKRTLPWLKLVKQSRQISPKGIPSSKSPAITPTRVNIAQTKSVPANENLTSARSPSSTVKNYATNHSEEFTQDALPRTGQSSTTKATTTLDKTTPAKDTLSVSQTRQGNGNILPTAFRIRKPHVSPTLGNGIKSGANMASSTASAHGNDPDAVDLSNTVPGLASRTPPSVVAQENPTIISGSELDMLPLNGETRRPLTHGNPSHKHPDAADTSESRKEEDGAIGNTTRGAKFKRTVDVITVEKIKTPLENIQRSVSHRSKRDGKHAGPKYKIPSAKTSSLNTHLGSAIVHVESSKRSQTYPVPRAPPGITFFRTLSKRPLKEGELLEESDDEPDETWLDQQHAATIDNFSDVSRAEKEFIKKFDGFFRARNIPGKAYVASSVRDFVEKNRLWLRDELYLAELVKKATILRRTGALTLKDIAEFIQIVRCENAT